MTLFVARNVSFVLMLVAFPLISLGTMDGPPVLWWIGLAALTIASLMPPVMRFLPSKEPKEYEAHEATDLAETCRVC